MRRPQPALLRCGDLPTAFCRLLLSCLPRASSTNVCLFACHPTRALCVSLETVSIHIWSLPAKARQHCGPLASRTRPAAKSQERGADK